MAVGLVRDAPALDVDDASRGVHRAVRAQDGVPVLQDGNAELLVEQARVGRIL